MTVCEHCGHDMVEGDSFCRVCGKQAQTPPADAATVPSAPSAPSAPAEASQSEPADGGSRRKARLPVAVAAVAAVLLVIAIALFWNGDPYSGTWSGTMPDGEQITIDIQKSGAEWLMTVTDNPDEDAITGREVDGRLTLTAEGMTVFLDRQGDDLMMSLDGVPGYQVPFTRQ